MANTIQLTGTNGQHNPANWHQSTRKTVAWLSWYIPKKGFWSHWASMAKAIQLTVTNQLALTHSGLKRATVRTSIKHKPEMKTLACQLHRHQPFHQRLPPLPHHQPAAISSEIIYRTTIKQWWSSKLLLTCIASIPSQCIWLPTETVSLLFNLPCDMPRVYRESAAGRSL